MTTIFSFRIYDHTVYIVSMMILVQPGVVVHLFTNNIYTRPVKEQTRLFIDQDKIRICKVGNRLDLSASRHLSRIVTLVHSWDM